LEASFTSSSFDSPELALWFGAGIEVSGDLLTEILLGGELLNLLKLSFLCSCKAAILLDLRGNVEDEAIFEGLSIVEHHLKQPIINPH
jgi:hypothetical protein